ncbi:hypothetical protein RG2014_038 [Delftia phage RG-2014]|jgi:hypothetical protein|uniref:Uncharacterized protein n=1 Tax=Delftia phage RG-2014 TaxID=1563661 RepID=A0A097PAK1_9CAUD|nr:hypothetical protein RG2014_038 [Delftia phage RG-2014]AIU44292.1 hypothetical protein RG2014_038 [Delftia phage RG-2014]
MNEALIVLTALHSSAVVLQFDVARIGMVCTASSGLKKDGTVIEYMVNGDLRVYHVRETVTEITKRMQVATQQAMSLRR